MPTTLRAAAEFSEVFRQMNAAPAAPPAPELVQYCHDDFLPRLARMSDGVPAIESYLPAGSAARQLQLDYIARNPHTDEEKDQLLAAPHDVGAVVFEVFSFYPPAALTPAAFFAAPIVQDGITIGVIAVQLSINDIDSVMT